MIERPTREFSLRKNQEMKKTLFGHDPVTICGWIKKRHLYTLMYQTGNRMSYMQI